MGRKLSAAAATASDETLTATMPADLLAATDCGGVHTHALFFDALVQLIPPRFYLPSGDEDRPWYQGLSKFAKAAMKAQSHANVKAALRAPRPIRAANLHPGPPQEVHRRPGDGGRRWCR
jgi:hypothetical protein